MRLPLVCFPALDEPQLSWLRRLAWENRCSVVSLLDHCGVAVPAFSILALGLPDDDLRQITNATSVPLDALRGLGLREVFLRAGEPLITPELSSHQRGSMLAGSHINLDGRRRCPQCLIERQGAVSTRWLHRLSTCCITHQTLLIDMRTRRTTLPEHPLRVTAQPPGTRGHHRKSNPEWHQGAQPVRLDLRDLGLANTIDQILRGSGTEFAGRNLPPADVSRIIWSTVRLLARFLEPDDLELDQPRRAALRAYISRRPAGRARQREPNTRLRQEHEALAALAPSAWALAIGGDQAFRDELLDRVVARVRAANKRDGARVQSYHGLPEWIRAGIGDRMKRSASHRLVRANLFATRVARMHRSLRPSHIPQMLWLPTFEENFAALFPALTPDSGRTLCSILLLRMGPCTSLEDAARVLGQRGEPSIVAVQRLMKQTDAHPLGTLFSQRLQSLSHHLEQTTLDTDYAALRAEYEHCVRLTPGAAANIISALAAAGCLSDEQQRQLLHSPAGRTALACWIWVHATCSRRDKSPFHGTCPSRSTARAVASITTRLLDPNRDVLLCSLEAHHGMSLHAPALPPLI